MNPLNPEEVKAKIVAELEIAHLPEAEQEQIVATLAEALLERATTIIMAKIPEGELANVNVLAEAGDPEALKAKIMEFVPDAPQIIDTVIADGVAEYKQLVAEEKGTEQAQDPAAPDSSSIGLGATVAVPLGTPEVAEQAAPEPVSAEKEPQQPAVQPPIEENFVVDESGEAKLADDVDMSSPLINPNPPQQPAY